MRGVILVPTRELAIQVAGAVHRYGRDLGISVLPVYGGQSLGMQAKALSRGVDVVVATPGRALDLMRRRSFVLEGVEAVVLDEADEMLDLGFAEDLEAILEATPKTRQTALFSATLPQRIKGLAERRMRDPVRVAITSAPQRAGGRRRSARSPTSSGARRRRPRWAACWTWRTRPPRSSSAARAARWTSCRNRWPRAGTAWTPSTAASPRSSATG